ncbi:hypothetical protein FC820_06640 [Clostridium sporogenes]|uniref:hypothetical protein n=1 Tax=Clostridium sporogenes TaxID=1509 RepID=UPI0013D35ABE|nr:hypothetical protein [Clostridium sporogenes]EJE7236439.1 hypothetical protein [Clostridium botulinum]NFE81110.1 hypothetical protein [Clostridium sporogenes]NFG68014.1 hypothetical protein [Clostridium sporogenes]
MDIERAFELLDKYNLRNEAELECKRRKIDTVPYDMQGHNKVYIEFLSKQWVKFRDQLLGLQNIGCKCWDTIPEKIKPLHNECNFARYSLAKNNICCRYDYNIKLIEIEQEMYELSEAQKALKDATERDYYLR